MKALNNVGPNSNTPTIWIVRNFLNYTSANYYLNWFIFGKVIAKIKK